MFLKIADELLFQSAAPRIIVGLTTTAFKPSPVPRHTSISPKNFVLPYSLLLVSSDHCIFSDTSSLCLTLPSAETELTCNNFSTLLFKQAFTILAVPSIFVACSNLFCLGLKATTAAQ